MTTITSTATAATEPGMSVTDALTLAEADPQVYAAIQGEAARLRDTIQLIPSENYPSAAVLNALDPAYAKLMATLTAR